MTALDIMFEFLVSVERQSRNDGDVIPFILFSTNLTVFDGVAKKELILKNGDGGI